MTEAIKRLPGRFHVDIALGIVLSVITCGFYSIYWNYLQFQAMNELLGRQEYKFWLWLILSIVTCGLFHIYYEYKMGSDLYAYMKEHGLEVSNNLPLLGTILAIFYLMVLSDAVYQHELNKLCA
ncbi:MAG: DUF4234 domain-containing protein [Elusimicrobia bacterium]|nr:DUF4234 domain-containing protein [Elusimicrobiota bacterium]